LLPTDSGFEQQCRADVGCRFHENSKKGVDPNKVTARCVPAPGSGSVPSRNASKACFLFGESRVEHDEIERLQDRCNLPDEPPDEYLRSSTDLQKVVTYSETEQRCIPRCDPTADPAHSRRCQLRTDNGTGQLVNFNCADQVIVPEFMAICVCWPTNEQDDTCTWNDPKPAAFRLQVFIQESFLAVILLLNYLAIAIEYLMRNGGRPLLPCGECMLVLGRASIPLVSSQAICRSV